VRETAQSGLVARLPYVGELTWRCDDEHGFSTELELPSPGATVFVSLTSDGEPRWRNGRVDPVPAPKRTSVGPFPALDRQTWTIRYSHKPATLTVRVRLGFSAPPPPSHCLVSRTSVEVRRTAH
jgi:hypothetical protein